VLYETLTGVNPFNAADLAAVLYRIVNLEPHSVRHHHAELPAGLDRVLRRALAKEPESRYATATDFADALREAATGERRTWSLRAVRETARDVRRAKLFSRPVRVTVAAMCLLALGVGTWASLRPAPDIPPAATPAPSVKREIEPAARPAAPKTAAPKPAAPKTAVATESAQASSAPTVPAATTATSSAAAPKAGAATGAAPTAAAPTATAPTAIAPAATASGATAPAPRAASAKTPAARPASSTVAASTVPAPGAIPVAATPEGSRCLSVNALPFAEVFVDDRPAGYTPTACLRVPTGEHRVRFEMEGQKSPERVLRITARHTPDAPMRLSYDFNTGRFIEQ